MSFQSAVASESRIESKTMRMNSVQKWWLHCLQEAEVAIKRDRGNYPVCDHIVQGDWMLQSINVPRKQGYGLYDSYLSECKVLGMKPYDNSSFGKQLESFGIVSSGNKKIVGERYYTVPKIREARDIFANDILHETTDALFPEGDDDESVEVVGV